MPKSKKQKQANKHLNKANSEVSPLNPISELDGFISLAEASGLCSYSQEYLSLLARKGLIGAVKRGRNWVITRRVLFDYIDQNSVEQKGNFKGQIASEEKARLSLYQSWLTSNIKDLAFGIWQKAKQVNPRKLVGKALESSQNMALRLRRDFAEFGSGRQSGARVFSALSLGLFWKRLAATTVIAALGVVSLQISPVAAKYYSQDIARIGQVIDATLVRSFKAAQKSFAETKTVYDDTLAFVKEPDFKTAGLALTELGKGFKALGFDIVFGDAIMAGNFSEAVLGSSLQAGGKFVYGAAELSNKILITQNTVRDVLANLQPSPDSTQENNISSFKKLALNLPNGILKNYSQTVNEFFGPIIDSYKIVFSRATLLAKNRIKPLVDSFQKNVQQKAGGLFAKEETAGQVAGVFEAAQNNEQANGLADNNSLSRKKSFLAQFKESFKNNFNFLKGITKFTADSLAVLPDQFGALGQELSNRITPTAGILARVVNGFETIGDLTFKKFAGQIKKAKILSGIAYQNLVSTSQQEIVSRQYLTLDQAKEIFGGSFGATITYVNMGNGQVAVVVGPPGPKGEKGEQGLSGVQGLPGSAGTSGVQGERGGQGSQGASGPSGSGGGYAGGGGGGGASNVTYYGSTPVYNNNTVFQSLSALESLAVGRGGIGSGGNLTVAGSVDIGDNTGNDTLTVKGGATFNGGITVASGAATTLGGALSVASTASFASNISVGGKATITAASGNISTEGGLTAGGNVDITGNITVGGSTVGATTTLSATGTNTILTVRQGGAGDLFNAYDGATEVFTILDGGKVGLGTSTPTAQFTIKSVLGQNYDILKITSTTNNTFLRVLTTGQTVLSAYPKASQPAFLLQPYNVSTFNQSTSTMVLVNASSTFQGDLISLQLNGSPKFRVDYQGNAVYFSNSIYGGDVDPSTDNTYDIGDLLTTKRWRDVSLYRNLNVGAVNTADKLVRVSSTTIAVYQTDLTIQTNNSQDILLNPNGNKVGVGTSTPVGQLSASSTNFIVAVFDQRGTSDILQLRDGGSTVFKVMDGGNVGIGTTTPTARLSVSSVSQSSTPLFRVASTTNANLFSVASTGKVAVGTSTAYDLLHVGGFIRTETVDWTLNHDFGASINKVESLAVYNGKLYAGLGSGDGEADVYVYDVSSWTLSNDFGVSINNVESLAVYNGKLYAGLGTGDGDADVYVYDGSSWTLSNDFGGSLNSVHSLAVYNGKLYAGLGTGEGEADLYVYDGSSWTLSNDFGGSFNQVESLAVYNGKLYAGLGSADGDADVYVYDGSSWTLSNDFGAGIYQVRALAAYNGKLYAGLGGIDGNADVYVYDGSSWTLSNDFGVSINNVLSLVVYNGKLYAGIGGNSGESNVYVHDGSSWKLSKSFGALINEVVKLSVYNGKLYAGTAGGDDEADLWVYSERLESQLVKEFNPQATTPFNEQYQFFTKNLSALGKIGAGTSTPTGQLSASSTNAITAIFDQRGTSDILRLNDDGVTVFKVADGGNVGIGTTTPLARIAVAGTSGAHPMILVDARTGFANSLIDLKIASSSKFLINSSGNVGIGTTTPSALLAVNTTAGVNPFAVGSSTASYFMVDKNGKVGIGTTTPAGRFAVNATSYIGLVVNQAGTSDILRLNDNGVTVFKVADGGLVGIGTTTPTARLSVSSASQSAPPLFRVASTTNATYFQIASTGKTSIGSTDVIQDLLVYNAGGSSFSLNASNNGSDSWTRVAVPGAGGFTAGLNNLYSLVTFNGKLYASTGDNAGEAEIYQSSDGTTWTRVAVSGSGGFTASLNAVFSMATFNGKLYAGTGYSNGQAEIYSSSDGTTWTRVAVTGSGGFTSNLDWILSFATFNGKLYAGTGSGNGEAEIYQSSDGTTWTRVAVTGSGGWTANLNYIHNLTTFNGKLYAGTGSGNGEAEIYQSSDGTTWTRVAVSGSGGFTANLNVISAFTTFNGKLYAGTGLDAGEAEIYSSSNGTTWSRVAVSGSGGFTSNLEFIISLITFNGKLYAGTADTASTAGIYQSSDGTTWTRVAVTGSGGFTANLNYIDSLATFNGKLYAGTGKDNGEAEIYQLTPAKSTALGYLTPSGDLEITAERNIKLGSNLNFKDNRWGLNTNLPNFDLDINGILGVGGRVAVGTSTPSAALAVSTAEQKSPSYQLLTVASTTGATLFQVLGSGAVGLATTTPAGRFAVNATNMIGAVINQAGTSDIFRLNDNGTTVFKVQDGGYVGVGTNTPKSVLSVSTLAQVAPTTQLFTVASTTGQVLLKVLANGQIQAPKSGLCVDDDGSCTATVGTINAVTFAAAGHSDVAEQYPSLQELEAGDLVMADSNNEGYVVKTTGEYSNNVIGVVSSQPGLLLAAETEGYPIALVGRIPTKVTSLNGDILPGDLLTVAPIAGYAMKLNDNDTSKVIGTALESFNGENGDELGMISMFINPDYRSMLAADSFGNITDGEIATNAAISDLKLGIIRTAGKIALTALPVEIALLQGDTQTFTGNYIFGADANTADLVVFNSKLGSDINFAVDGIYNIGSASSSVANVYTRTLNASKLVVAENTEWQNVNADDFGLYLSASSGLAYFGDNVLIGNSLDVNLPAYPDFIMDGSDLLVQDDLGIRGNLYVIGNVRVAGALEFAREGISQMMEIEAGEVAAVSGDVIVTASGTASGMVSRVENSTRILGVIGTSSGAVFGAAGAVDELPVVVSGVARVRVSAENGPIAKGDKLTTAASKGFAQLATKPGAGVLGLALEDLSGEAGVIRVLVALGAYYEPTARVITVAKGGADYNGIGEALASIGDNSIQKRYLIKVAPGNYQEDGLILKDYVDIVGEGQGLVIIESNDSPMVVASANSRLEGVSLKSSSNSGEPLIANIASGSPIFKNVRFEAETNNPATGLSISGNPERVRLSDVSFGSNFITGIVNLSSSTVAIANSEVEINGLAMQAQNGLIRSSNTYYNGVLGDISVAAGAVVESKADTYSSVNNLGIFLDTTNKGKIESDYIDYGWLVEAEEGLSVKVSAGEGYVNGVRVNASEQTNIALSATSTNYLLMSDAGEVAVARQLASSTAGLLIASVAVSDDGALTITNERVSEIVVAKQGGQFRTISSALDSIVSASENNRWKIKIESGVYNEQLALKPFVDIIGSGKDNTTVMSINRPVIVEGESAASSSVKIANLKLSLAGDSLGQAVVRASSTNLTLEDVAIAWTGNEGVSGTAIETNGNMAINRLSAFGMAYGLTVHVNSSATSSVNIYNSSIGALLADIRTINEDEEYESSGINIASSYNTLTGAGTNFEAARGTVISSAHDTYLNYSGEGQFRQNDYFKNISNGASVLFTLQNAGLNLFSVSASGTVAINPQNTTGDSVVISSPTASTTLTVVNTGAGSAIKAVGNVIITSATSGIPVVLSSAGAELNIGAVGDIINLNVDGVTYNFKENVRRNTLSAYLPAPASGDRVWGNGESSWSPPENITILGIKVQYNCSDDAYLSLLLKDKNGQTIASLASFSCGGYSNLEQAGIDYGLTPEDGMYLEVESAAEGITNVTVTVEFVYDNR